MIKSYETSLQELSPSEHKEHIYGQIDALVIYMETQIVHAYQNKNMFMNMNPVLTRQTYWE